MEYEEAAAILAGIGCEKAQGFLYRRPMEAEQFAEWLVGRHAPEMPLPDVA